MVAAPASVGAVEIRLGRLGFGRLEAFAALFAVAVERVEDDRIGLPGRADFVHFNGFAFELFVVLKKRRSIKSRCGGISDASW